MGFWSKLGDAWNAVKGTPAAIGGAFMSASDAVDNSTAGKWLAEHDFTRALDKVRDLPVLGQIDNTGAALGGASMNTLAVPVNTVGKAMSTWNIANTMDANYDPGSGVIDPGKPGGSIFDRKTWSTAWDIANKVSAGQSTLIGTGLVPEDVTLAQTPEASAARDDWFHNHAAGQLSSGTLDLALNLWADPTVGAARSLKLANEAATTLRAGEATAVMAAARGGAAETSRIDRMGQRVNEFVDWTQGKTAAEIALHPAVAASPEKGTLAHLLSQAGDPDESRMLIGASLGDGNSIIALAEKNAYLADELQALTKAPRLSAATESFSWDDHGQGFLTLANEKLDDKLVKHRDRIVAEMTRLDRLASATATTNKVAGFVDPNLNGLRVTTLRTTFAGRTITAVKGSAASRLEGHINIADPVKGYDQLDKSLRQARWVTGARRNELLSEYASAASKGDRQGVLRKAEAEVVMATAAQYGLTPEQAKKVLAMGTGLRKSYQRLVETRLYSARPEDAHVAMLDPDHDMLVVRDKPSTISQIESHHPFVDPRDLEAFLKKGANERLFDKMSRYIAGDTGQAVATKVHSVTDPMAEYTGYSLMQGMRFWKDSMLLTRAPAYAVRTQVDAQARNMIHSGVLAYTGMLLNPRSGVLATGLRSIHSRSIFREPDYDKVVRPFLKRYLDDLSEHGGLPYTTEEYEGIVRRLRDMGGGPADMADELINHTQQKVRTSGSWKRLTGDDPAHPVAYLRVVNRQLKNSPTAVQAMAGATLDDLRKFVLENPDGQKEWLELAGSWDHKVDHWLANLQADVQYYLPTPELREAAATRQLKQADYDTAFDPKSGVPKMDVHGETTVATSSSGIGKVFDWYNNTARAHMYKLVSDAPEVVMARSPLYVQEFNRQARRIAAGYPKEMLDQRAVADIRKQADRLARRNMGRVLFDSADSSNLGHTMRYLSPFWGAWEDMVKKWGGILYDNPQALERFRQTWDAPNNAGLVVDEYGNRVDADGNRLDKDGNIITDAALIGRQELLVVPAGVLRRTPWFKDAQDIRFRKNGFNVLFQGEPWWLPGSGPLVSVPANEFVKKSWPEADGNPIIRWLLPYGPTDSSVPMQLIPAWARNFRNSYGGTSDYTAQMSMFHKANYIAWEQGGRQGPPPGLDKAANQAKNWFLMKAMIGMNVPVSGQPNSEIQFYIDQAHIYQQKYGDLAQEKFKEDFPEYYDLAISTSATESGLNMNIASVSAFKKYKKEIAAAPEWAWAIAGPDTAYGLDPEHKFSSYARTTMLTTEVTPGGDTIRRELSPLEALARAEESKGWRDYQQVRTQVDLELEKRGLTSLQQRGAEDLAQTWKSFRTELAQENEHWARAYGQRDDAKVGAFLTDMRDAMAKSKDLAARPDMRALSDYMSVREAVQAEMRNRGVGTLDNENASDLKQMWDAFCLELQAETPSFSGIYTRMLDSDTLTTEVGRRG